MNKKNWKEHKLLQEWNAFWKQEEGVGTIEIVLLLVGILTPYYGVSIKCIT